MMDAAAAAAAVAAAAAAAASATATATLPRILLVCLARAHGNDVETMIDVL